MTSQERAKVDGEIGMGSRRLDHMLNEVTTLHGHSAPILHLAGTIGHNARWEGQARQEQLARVVKLLAEAGDRMKRIEADEAEERKLYNEYGV